MRSHFETNCFIYVLLSLYAYLVYKIWRRITVWDTVKPCAAVPHAQSWKWLCSPKVVKFLVFVSDYRTIFWWQMPNLAKGWVHLVRTVTKMTMKSVSVLLYTTNEFTTIQCFDGITSEELCMKLCVKLSITPAACLLFALRISGTKFFIPADQTIRFSVQYEFRLRFEVCIHWKCCFANIR